MLKVLVEALEYYGNSMNWDGPYIENPSPDSGNSFDGYEIASEALERFREGSDDR